MRVLLAFLLLIGTVTSQIDKFLYELPDCAVCKNLASGYKDALTKYRLDVPSPLCPIVDVH